VGSNGSAGTKGIPATDKYSFPAFEKQSFKHPDTGHDCNLKPTTPIFAQVDL